MSPRYLQIVIDGGWYNGCNENEANACIDEFGRPKPNPDMYPSSQGGQGFAPLVRRLKSIDERLNLGV